MKGKMEYERIFHSQHAESFLGVEELFHQEDSLWKSFAPDIESDVQRTINFTQESPREAERKKLISEIEDEHMTPDNKKMLIRILNETGVKSKERKKSMSKEQWDSLVNRLNSTSEKKIKKMEEIVREREEEIRSLTPFKPHINKRSRHIANTSGNLSERNETFLEEKRQKIERMKQQLEKNISKETTFKPNLSKKARDMNRDVDNLMTWDWIKKRKQEEKRRGKKDVELERCTFRPEVTERTKRIMDRAEANSGINVYDRNYYFEFVKQARNEKRIREAYLKDRNRNPSITPLASNLPRSEPVGDRLYRLAGRQHS